MLTTSNLKVPISKNSGYWLNERIAKKKTRNDG